jgi:hypothetical protein
LQYLYEDFVNEDLTMDEEFNEDFVEEEINGEVSNEAFTATLFGGLPPNKKKINPTAAAP